MIKEFKLAASSDLSFESLRTSAREKTLGLFLKNSIFQLKMVAAIFSGNNPEFHFVDSKRKMLLERGFIRTFHKDNQL